MRRVTEVVLKPKIQASKPVRGLRARLILPGQYALGASGVGMPLPKVLPEIALAQSPAEPPANCDEPRRAMVHVKKTKVFSANLSSRNAF